MFVKNVVFLVGVLCVLLTLSTPTLFEYVITYGPDFVRARDVQRYPQLTDKGYTVREAPSGVVVTFVCTTIVFGISAIVCFVSATQTETTGKATTDDRVITPSLDSYAKRGS